MVQKPWVSKRESVRQITSSPSNPPPPPAPPSLSGLNNVETESSKETISRMDATPPAGNFLLKSVNAVEKEFWSREDEKRKPGVLVLAVNHVYKDVYRLPITLS